MNLIPTERIRQTLPLERGYVISRILAIMDGLCPSCPENKGFNPAAACDCTKRSGHITAAQVYDGKCPDDTLEHWLGALQDYVGALQLLAVHFGDRDPLFDINHDRYVDGCRRAQSLIMGHQDDESWNGWQYVESHHGDDYALVVGMAYKLADTVTDKDGNINPVYAEMCRLGKEGL